MYKVGTRRNIYFILFIYYWLKKYQIRMVEILIFYLEIKFDNLFCRFFMKVDILIKSENPDLYEGNWRTDLILPITKSKYLINLK